VSQRFALSLTVLITLVTTAVCAWCFWFAPHGPPPPLQVVPGQVDLGELFLYESKDFGVEVRNPGKEVVEVSGLRTDCKCADVKLHGPRLEPGQTARLTGTFTGTSQPGVFVRQVVLSVAEPEPCHFRLPIVGEARRRISFSPQSLVLRPDFPRGKPGAAVLVVRNGSDETVEVKLPEDAPLALSTSIDKRELAPGDACKISVEADPASVIARAGDLELRCSHSREKTIKIPVEVQPVQGVSVAPETIAFGVLSKQALLKREGLTLQLQGDLVPHCRIGAVSCPNYLKVESTEQETPATCRVALGLQDEFERADLGGTIAVSLRHKPSNRVFHVEVDVSGFLVDARDEQVE